MQLEKAQQLAADIKAAAEQLNDKIRIAADVGVATNIATVPVQFLGVAVFDIVEVTVTVDPTKIE